MAAENLPDFRTISDFRKEHGVALLGSFEQVLKLYRRAGPVKPGQVAADAGYWSDENVETLEAKKIDPYIARGSVKHGKSLAPAPRRRNPAR